MRINAKHFTLECKETEGSNRNLCSKYGPNSVECLNLNYQKEQVPEFECNAQYLNERVKIGDYQIACTSDQSPAFENEIDQEFENNLKSCNLQISLAEKTSKNAISYGKPAKPRDDKLNVLYFVLGGFLVSILIGLTLGYLSLCIVPTASNKKKRNLITESVPDVVMSSSFSSTSFR